MTITRPGFSGDRRKWVQIVNYIIDRIESGNLPKFTAGRPPELRKAIPDRESLCLRFGVSGQPVTHAYRYLRGAGIILKGPHGHYVREQPDGKTPGRDSSHD